MNFTLHNYEQGLVIYLEDSHDIPTLDGIYYSVIENAHLSKKITFDFSKIDFIDSTGIGFILFECRKLMDQGYRLKIINQNKDIRDLFELLGVPYILGEAIFQ
jgi:anti-anti-sigma factor